MKLNRVIYQYSAPSFSRNLGGSGRGKMITVFYHMAYIRVTSSMIKSLTTVVCGHGLFFDQQPWVKLLDAWP